MATLYFRQLLAGRDFGRDDPIAAQMQNFVYLIGDRDTGECVVVDPAWAVDELVGLVEGAGMRLVGALATHYHPDHAGLAEDLKLRGVRLIVLDQQVAAIPLLRSLIKPQTPFSEITLRDTIRLSAAASADFLRGIGIAGTIIGTPGHSDDSVTLVLASGEAFTGDLPGPSFDGAFGDVVTGSWRAIRAAGARTVYPGHGPPRPMPPADG